MGPSISNATTISSIKITRQNVFDSEVEKENWFVYRWANSLHIKTREWVIRDQLLYEIGDKLDTLRILETERNLRSLEFIGGAITRIYFNSDSSEADIELTVSDQWSTIAGPTSKSFLLTYCGLSLTVGKSKPSFVILCAQIKGMPSLGLSVSRFLFSFQTSRPVLT